jgi:ankyrin repeat protein
MDANAGAIRGTSLMKMTQVLVCGWTAVLLAVPSPGSAASESAVMAAARSGDVAALRKLVAQRVDVNAAEPDGTTPLHWAAHNDSVEAADLLIRAGANVKAANRYGVTPLWAACTNGNAALITRLLDAGGDPNAALPEGETALMTAARSGNADAVRVLLARGARVNPVEGWRKQTALMWAAAEGHRDVVKVLLEAGADIKVRSSGEGKFTAFLFAVRAGHRGVVDVLLDAGADVNEQLADATSALHLAIINAHFELAATLLKRGAQANHNGPGWTPLHQLTWTRRPNQNRGLLPPIPTGSLTSMDLAKVLIAHGADPNARMTRQPTKDLHRHMGTRLGSTPLLNAAKLADAEMMRFLLANGADPTIKTVTTTTLLMWAAGVGIWNIGESAGTNEEALEAVKVALETGADVNAVDDRNETALHGAAYRGANEIVKLLVEKGANLNVKNENAWTPLVITEGVFYPNTFQRRLDTAELLRKLGAEPSPPDVPRRVIRATDPG